MKRRRGLAAARGRAILYGIARAFGSASRRPLVSLLATGAIGISLLLVGVVHLAATNADRLTRPFGRGAQMVVYLDDDVSPERARQIGEILLRSRAIEKVDYVPPDAALARLAESLGDRKELLHGVEVGYLPASLEVTLAGGIREVAAVSPLLDRLRRTEGVEEVELLGDWVERLSSLLFSLRLVALSLLLLVSAACVYIVASTIQLGMYTRRDEIEILKLVGATDAFVKAPLVVEGALQGLCGAAMALGLLYGLYRASAPALERMLAGASFLVDLSFLPVAQGVALLAIGAFLGLAGSFLAIGRYAEV